MALGYTVLIFLIMCVVLLIGYGLVYLLKMLFNALDALAGSAGAWVVVALLILAALIWAAVQGR